MIILGRQTMSVQGGSERASYQKPNKHWVGEVKPQTHMLHKQDESLSPFEYFAV